MAPVLGSKQDPALWSWVGNSITSPDSIQDIHLRQAYALTPESERPYCINQFAIVDQGVCSEPVSDVAGMPVVCNDETRPLHADSEHAESSVDQAKELVDGNA